MLLSKRVRRIESTLVLCILWMLVVFCGINVYCGIYIEDITTSHAHPGSHARGAVRMTDQQSVDRLGSTVSEGYQQYKQTENQPDTDPRRQILIQLGILNETRQDRILDDLPTWKEIETSYGKRSRIVGLETCGVFRERRIRTLAPAGVFNSGTNLLFRLLERNCNLPKRSVQWQVPWGKHWEARFRGVHTAPMFSPNPRVVNNTLPIVVIRDPYFWMQSMCHQSYEAKFEHTGVCPNLVPTEQDRATIPRYQNVTYVPVNVVYDHTTHPPTIIKHTSLAHYWNEWYRGYLPPANRSMDTVNNNDDFPRVIVRMEDLLFRGEETVARICDCARGISNRGVNFTHIQETAKIGSTRKNTAETGLLDALRNYGNATNRANGFLQEQLEAAKTLLDPEIMQMFGYVHPSKL